MLAFTAAAALAFAAAGWYLDWYQIRTGPSSVAGHRTVTIDVNGIKIAEDVNKGVQKGSQKLHDALEKGSQGATSPALDTSRTDGAGRADVARPDPARPDTSRQTPSVQIPAPANDGWAPAGRPDRP